MKSKIQYHNISVIRCLKIFISIGIWLMIGTIAAFAQDDGSKENRDGLTAYFQHDYATAMTLYQIAAGKGNVEAIMHIGDLYTKGYGVAKSEQEAKKWYQKGKERYIQMAQSGNARAAETLASLYYFGTKVDHNYAEALKYYLPKAEKGHVYSMYTVANMYENGGFGINKDLKKAAEWYLKQHDYGEDVSEALLRIGVPVPQKLSAEEEYARMMAKADNMPNPSDYRAGAFKSYTTTLLKDSGTPQDLILTKAKEKLQAMTAVDFYAAYRSVSRSYTEQLTVKDLFAAFTQPQKDAIKLLADRDIARETAYPAGVPEPGMPWGGTAKPTQQVAANTASATNQPPTQTNQTANADYSNGLAADQQNNYTEALNWYRKAAEKGHTEAKFMLGTHYILGKGMAQNYTEARKWLREAAAEGNIRAVNMLWEMDRAGSAFLMMSPGLRAESNSGKYGYWEDEGQWIIPPKYEDGGNFSMDDEGLVPAKLNGKWGFINDKDQTVIPFQYEDADIVSFVNGLAVVKQQGKWGFIDKTGKTAILFQYDKIELGYFVNGYAKVIKDGRMFYIDKTGKELE